MKYKITVSKRLDVLIDYHVEAETREEAIKKAKTGLADQVGEKLLDMDQEVIYVEEA